MFNGNISGFHPDVAGSNPVYRSKELIVKVKDVRALQEELGDAIAEMITSFEAETGCFIDEFIIERDSGKPWIVGVAAIVEV